MLNFNNCKVKTIDKPSNSPDPGFTNNLKKRTSFHLDISAWRL